MTNNYSPIQDYLHPDDQTQPTFEMDNTIHQINLLPVDNAMTLVSLMNWIIFPWFIRWIVLSNVFNNIKVWVDWGTVTVKCLAQADITVTQLS